MKRDSTAIVLCTWDEEAKRSRLVYHRVFQPSAQNPLDFEATIETTMRELQARFELREVRFDPVPDAGERSALTARRRPMVEFPQSVPNLTEASTNLYDLIKGRGLAVYPDADMRLSVSRAVALETTRGWRIAKEKVSHKIDVVVALAQAALGAVRGGQTGSGISDFYQARAERQARGEPEPEPDNSLVDEYNREIDRLLDLEDAARGVHK